MADSASIHANTLKGDCEWELYHSQGTGYGENLYMCGGSACYSAEAAMQALCEFFG